MIANFRALSARNCVEADETACIAVLRNAAFFLEAFEIVRHLHDRLAARLRPTPIVNRNNVR